MLDYLVNLRKLDAVPNGEFTPDPLGYFVIRALKTGKVRAEHYTTADEVTTIIVGTADDVRATVLHEFPTIDVYHYGYVCAELVRAECLGLDYVQS